jgi:glycosyltransferase involved in cell wall biosynthesis
MKIAQFSSLYEAVPPLYYGGIERVVHYLTEQLVRMGHEVVLFASGDSCTSAQLIPCCPRGLRDSCVDPVPDMLTMLWDMRARLSEFDILHFHTDLLRHSVFRRIAGRALTTMHGQPEDPDSIHPDFYRCCSATPLVSISTHQRLSTTRGNWLRTIHHGIPLGLLPLTTRPRGNYLAFLGRISWKKGTAYAIEIARRARMRLLIAGKVDSVDREYFESQIWPRIDGRNVEFVGEIDDRCKAEFLGNARAVLFPIDWPEAFGLVMIEAMACGTPVVAFSRGSVPEIVEEGITGFVVESVDAAAKVVECADNLDRARIRARFEARYSDTRMTLNYLDVYLTLCRSPRACL